MDFKFLLKSSAILISFILILLIIPIQQYDSSRMWMYLTPELTANGAYPPLGTWIIDFFNLFIERPNAVITVEILFAVILPVILIHAITKKMKACIAYLFISGIALMLLEGQFIAQSITQVYMLLSLLNPLGYVVFVCLGWLTHREWIWAFILTFLYDRFVRRF